MSKRRKAMGPEDADIAGTDAALRRAAKRALQIGLETGTPVYAIVDGEIVDLTKQRKHRHRS